MMRNFNWKILSLFFISTALVTILATATFAYQTYEAVPGGVGASCATCHFGFQDSGPLHEQHLSLNVGCYRCHEAHRIITVTTSLSIDGKRGCVGCHGRWEDAGYDLISEGLGAGLRQHHYNSGEESCQICHRDSIPSSYTLVGEDAYPPFYVTDGLDPCTDILDNDGDLLYDETDPNCVLNSPSCGG
jgi:predicted CXXCH cytochrome family protein